jgi:hypothetical protein
MACETQVAVIDVVGGWSRFQDGEVLKQGRARYARHHAVQ